MKDPYLDLVAEQWDYIVRLYVAFEHKRPVMLFDVQEKRIYAYPYAEFKADLSKRSQALLKKQYSEAIAEDKIVVFVRDNEKRKLLSCSLPKSSRLFPGRGSAFLADPQRGQLNRGDPFRPAGRLPS